MFGKMILENGTVYSIDVMDIEKNSFNKIAIFGVLNYSISTKIDAEENSCKSDWYGHILDRLSHMLYPYSGKIYKKIIFSYPATIVIWNDGSKTVVKCQEGEHFDKEKCVAMCFMKKFLGNKSNFNNVFRDCGELNEGVKNE